MRNILLHENAIHPYSQPQDYIKLIFQSEFGPGHLIADASYSKKRLVDEWETVKNLPAEEHQDIGGGYVRLCIKGIDSQQLEAINNAFFTSANEKSGSETGFKEKINLFLAMAEEGVFTFDFSTAKEAVDNYMSGGIRPTSHTKIYHSHYTPAYRVVNKKFLNI